MSSGNEGAIVELAAEYAPAIADFVADKAPEAVEAVLDYIVPGSEKDQPTKEDNNRSVSLVGADGMLHIANVRYLRASAGRVWDTYNIWEKDPAAGRAALIAIDLPTVAGMISSNRNRVDEKWLKKKQVKTRYGWKSLLWVAVDRERKLKQILGLSAIPTPQLPIWQPDGSTTPPVLPPTPDGLVPPKAKDNNTLYIVAAAVLLFVLMGRR